MPTSSQSLILQSTNGQLPNEPLPPIFTSGRQQWANGPIDKNRQGKDTSVMPSSVQLRVNSSLEQTILPSKNRIRSLPKQRLGTAPILEYKVDFSTLPQVLKIRGLHGSLAYNQSSNSVSWKLNSIGPFYDRFHPSPFRVAFNGVLSPNKADALPQSQFQARHVRFSYTHGDGRQGDTQEKERFPDAYKGPFMKYETTNGQPCLIATESRTPDFFKLVFNHSESATGQATYSLQTCKHNETGAFHLMPTNSTEVGEYKLVPPPGYLANDFRIIRSSVADNNFVILQPDNSCPGQFEFIQRNKDDPPEFRMVVAEVRSDTDRYFTQKRAWDVHLPRANTFSDQPIQTLRQVSPYPVNNRHNDITSMDYSYTYFGDVGMDGQMTTLQRESPGASFERGSPIGRYGVPWHPPFHSPQSPEQCKPTAADNSPDRYNTLVSLGFRKVKDPKEVNDSKSLHSAIKTNVNIAGRQFTSSEWKTHNFDNWSRTAEAPPAFQESTFSNPDYTNIGKSHTDDKENISLIDEVKLKADYKQWKKKKITTVRMRKELPPEDQNAVCVRLSDNAISHDQVKRLIEIENNVNLVSLQFDPISVHSIDSEAKSQWILRFENSTICDVLVTSGLRIGAVTYPVRKFNDAMREEHDAYKFYEIIKQMNQLKQRKTKKSKSSETQTAMSDIKIK